MSAFAENKPLLENLPAGVFLVRDDKTTLTVHAFDDIRERGKRDALNALPKDRPVRFVLHRVRAVRSTLSLAEFNRRFAGGPIVYDPTAVFTRASEIVRYTTMLRAELGKKAGRVLFDTARRALYVVLEDGAFIGKELVFRAQIAETITAIGKTIDAWKRAAPADFEFSVKVGFEPPKGLRLVAVDRKSRKWSLARHLFSLSARMRMAAGVAAVGAVTAGAPAMADGNGGDSTAAVSLPNFSLIGQGGYEGGFGAHDKVRGDLGVEGTVPLGHSFGLQGEAGIGSDNYYGGGGHLFWRDPDWAMLGAVASYESLGGITMARYGGEAELYLNNWTLSARGGGQSGDVKNGAFIRGDITIYLTPHFAARAGFESAPDLNFGRVGFEFQPAAESLSGLSLYTDGTFGQGTTIVAGFRFHFGDSGSSLIYRDRHEDPNLAIFNLIPLRIAQKLLPPPYVGGGGGGSGPP